MGYYDGDLIRFSGRGTTGEGMIHTVLIICFNIYIITENMALINE